MYFHSRHCIPPEHLSKIALQQLNINPNLLWILLNPLLLPLYTPLSPHGLILFFKSLHSLLWNNSYHKGLGKERERKKISTLTGDKYHKAFTLSTKPILFQILHTLCAWSMDSWLAHWCGWIVKVWKIICSLLTWDCFLSSSLWYKQLNTWTNFIQKVIYDMDLIQGWAQMVRDMP